MNDKLLHDTIAALLRALARIAVDVSGSKAGAESLIADLLRGKANAAAESFLSEGAAMIRVRQLLAA